MMKNGNFVKNDKFEWANGHFFRSVTISEKFFNIGRWHADVNISMAGLRKGNNTESILKIAFIGCNDFWAFKTERD